MNKQPGCRRGDCTWYDGYCEYLRGRDAGDYEPPSPKELQAQAELAEVFALMCETAQVLANTEECGWEQNSEKLEQFIDDHMK